METVDLRTQILIILAAIAFLWLSIKTLKWIWKLSFGVFIFLGLSFALPAIREWIFGLF